MALTEKSQITTPQVGQLGNKTVPTPYLPHAQWEPAFDGRQKMIPVGWKCPCGYGTVIEAAACPHCGRIPRDRAPHGKLDGSQRCITGRQGRDYKRLAKRGR